MSHGPRAERRQVLAIGEILIDFIVDDGATSLETAQSFVARAGGAPANVAVALARLGVDSAFCGVSGMDPFGTRLVTELQAAGVDTSRLRQSREAPTTIAYAWKDGRGDGHFWLQRGADLLLSADDTESAGVDRLEALIVGSVSLAEPRPRAAIERAIALAAKAGVPIVFDVNLRPTVWPELSLALPLCQATGKLSKVVKLSLDDAQGLFGATMQPEEAIEQVRTWGPESIVLTDGQRGCWFTSGTDEIAFLPSFAVESIEPTGAGDAFLAALVTQSVTSKWEAPTTAAIRYAAAAGALATTKRGAWDGLPTAQQLEAFLKTV